jgi:endonuclease/exonuclease/phosphatase family metal-dependent hydrolase
MRVRVRPFDPLSWRMPRGMRPLLCSRLIATICCLLVMTAAASAQDIVLYSSDVSAIHGNWARTDSWSGAGTRRMTSADYGWAAADAAHANPTNYFEATFTAQANTDYRVWLRLRAAGDSKWNDSVWVQFSDSVNSSGGSLYRIGSSSGLLVNLEPCSNCGVAGWGWSGGAWWVNQATTVRFATAGTKTVRVQIREDGVDVDQIVLSASTWRHSAPGSATHDSTILPQNTGGSSGSSPSTSTRSIVGTIEAEDFDNGANGTAYWDSTSGNTGGQYRSTDVDIEHCAEGGFNIGWIASGEWLNYTVSVPSSGTYTLEFRVASPSGGGRLRALFNGEDKTGSVSVPATGGWQAWTTVRQTVNLSAGTQVMRVVFDTGGFNLNWIRGVSGGTSSSSSSGSATSSPFGGTPWAIPGTVQAVDFDEGGQGVAYRDHTPGNTGGAYRATDVDIAAIPSGGFTVGWVGAGEWLQYTVNVAAAGQYTLTARVASAGSGGTFHVKFDGDDRTGAMRVPNTGGWNTYQDVSATVSLAAGRQVMRLSFDTDGATGAVGNFASIRLASGVTAAPAPAPAPSGGTFRVMTWNLDHTRDPAGQTREIANSGADVVLLQEASRWHEDVRQTFPDRLRNLTGHTWTAVWASHFGRYSEMEGTMIVTRLPVVDQSIRRVHDRGFTRVLVSVGGVHVNVLNAHLDWYDTSMRSAQLEDFMWWGRQFGGPRIAGGDFNAWWGEWWIRRMTEEHTDTWVDVKGTVEGGYTLNGAVRFDYLFRAHTDNWRVTPTAIWVPWTGLSDHYPVIADYTVR